MEFPIESHPNTPPTAPKEGPVKELHQKQEDASFKTKVFAFGKWLWAFIKSPVFLKNTGALIVFLVLSFFVVSYGLNILTKHNQSVEVENYKGLDIEEAKRKARSRGFLVSTLHSPGTPGAVPNQVFQQYPDPVTQVKKGRTVYLSVYGSKMKKEKIPTFLGNDSYEMYAASLRGLIFTVVKETKFDAKLQPNTVLHIWHKGKKLSGADLKKGVTGHQGDTIKCVVTTRSSATVAIPKLVCLDYVAATFLLNNSNLNVGVIHGNFTNKKTAYVWKQVPAYISGKQITKNRSIELYLKDSRPAGCN